MTVLESLRLQFPEAKMTTLRRMLADGRVLRPDGKPHRKLTDPATHPLTVLDHAGYLTPPKPPATPAPQPDAPADKKRPQPQTPPKSQVRPNAVRPPVPVLFEDNHLIVVIKPPGLLSSTTENEKRPTLEKQLRAYLANTSRKSHLGVIHRLDRDVGGLMLFSKTPGTYYALKTALKVRDITRNYQALVHGAPNPPQGTIRSRLVEYADGTVHYTGRPDKGQPATTHYTTLATLGETSHLQLTLDTGRKHQIRAHLAHLGHPIVGDAAYGSTTQGPVLLAATHLAFTHPITGEPLTFTHRPHLLAEKPAPTPTQKPRPHPKQVKHQRKIKRRIERNAASTEEE